MSEHAKAQALRFVRITVYTLVAQVFALGHWPGWWALLPMLAGAAETGLRELLPVKAIPAISSVLAPASSPLGLPMIHDSATTTLQSHPGVPGGTPVNGAQVAPSQTGIASSPPPPAPNTPGAPPGDGGGTTQ